LQIRRCGGSVAGVAFQQIEFLVLIGCVAGRAHDGKLGRQLRSSVDGDLADVKIRPRVAAAAIAQLAFPAVGPRPLV